MMRFALVLAIASVAFAAAPKPRLQRCRRRSRHTGQVCQVEDLRGSLPSVSEIGCCHIWKARPTFRSAKALRRDLAKSGGAREVVNKIQIGEAARKKLSDRLQKARESTSRRRLRKLSKIRLQSKRTDHCCGRARYANLPPLRRRSAR